MKSRLLLIGMVVLLMLGGIFIVSTTLYEEYKTPSLPTTISTDLSPSIPIERNVFSRSKEALAYQQMPESKRSLADYYENRAYAGAPPSIPHPLISEKGIGGKSCLQCHQNGGFVDQFNAFAPITPHAELLNCKQCHVPKNTNLTFKPTNWKKMEAPEINQVALSGAPPVIPHDLDMRSNCLSCHAGAGAPKEIRVSHPERVNCRQCHLPRNTKELFIKPKPVETTFQRPDKTLGLQSQNLKESEVSQISNWVKNENH